jgi:uncharacterized protein
MSRKVLLIVLVAGVFVIVAGAAAIGIGLLPVIASSTSSPTRNNAPSPVESLSPSVGTQAPATGSGAGNTGQAPVPAGQPAPVSSTERQISVTGTGTASGTPDMAQIFVGVTTQNSSVSQAVSDNQKAMTTLLAMLKAQGIADADIRTSNYSLNTENPQGVPGKGTTSPEVLFDVSNQVHVTVRNIANLPTILDRVVAAGANNIFGVTFGITNPTSLQDSAREAAVKDALARAQALAKLEGVTLGDVLSVSESSSSGGPVPMAYGLGGGGTPVEPGAQDVTINLQVTYSIK